MVIFGFMQIADFGDLGFQRHVIIGIFGSSPFSGFRIRFSMLGGWFSGFRGAFLDFPGFDYEFQTLGATEPPRFSELY